MLLYILLVIISLFNVNVQDNVSNERANITATIHNNHYYNLSFTKCFIHGIIMSPISRIIMSNMTQELIMWSLLNDTTFYRDVFGDPFCCGSMKEYLPGIFLHL